MRYVTLESGVFLAGVANMLSLFGIDSTDSVIACGMEAPYLFLHEGDRYIAGAGLFTPECVNDYLQPRGFHLSSHTLPKGEVIPFLGQHRCAMLDLTVSKATHRMVVYYGVKENSFQFINLKHRFSNEPDAFAFSPVSLKRRLDETMTLYTLEECPPTPVDFIPRLLNSLRVLQSYRSDLSACPARVTPEAFHALDAKLFRPLMQDYAPVAALLNDDILHDEILLLQHDYRHMLIRECHAPISLRDRLPLDSVLRCLQYLHEDILDRLYELGAGDDIMERYTPLDFK